MPDWLPVRLVRIRSVCLVAKTCLSSSASTSSASRSDGGDEHGGGQRVVLGLADQVGGDVRRVGGVVGEDRDLGRPGLGVDADLALEQPLGGDRVDVARAGDQVDLGAGADAVREHGDRLGAADGVHLVDAEQRARGQDRRVHLATELLLRRAGERDRPHAGGLRGHDVHQHAGDQRGQAAGHVEADPVDRHLAVGDPGAGAEVGDGVVLELVGAGQRAAGGSTPRARPGSPGRAARGPRSVAPGRDPDVVDGRPRRSARRTPGWRRARGCGPPRRSHAPPAPPPRRRSRHGARLRGSRPSCGRLLAGRCAGSWVDSTSARLSRRDRLDRWRWHRHGVERSYERP